MLPSGKIRFKARLLAIPTIVLGLVPLAPGVAIAEEYFCSPEKATGFYYDEGAKDWKEAKFTTNMYYTISPIKFGKHAYTIKQFGDPDPVAFCHEGFNGAGLLLCQRRHLNFKFSKKTGKYILFSTGDYVSGPESPTSNTQGPWLQIGKCTAF